MMQGTLFKKAGIRVEKLLDKQQSTYPACKTSLFHHFTLHSLIQSFTPFDSASRKDPVTFGELRIFWRKAFVFNKQYLTIPDT